MNALCPTPQPPFPPYPPFPANPSMGQRFGSWVWNGTMWVVTPVEGVIVTRTVFLASGTYTPAPGLTTALVECMGGGGGGGAVNANLPVLYVVGGAGGGSGGYSRVMLAAALVAGGVQVTVGAGGASNTNGHPTSFGAFCAANGGFGANQSQAQYGGVAGGAGGNLTGAVGGQTLAGATGDNGLIQSLSVASSYAAGCPKGGQMWGGNLTGEVGPGAATAGPASWANSGAGGGGACVNQFANQPQMLGGAGGSGFCAVTEYCFLPASSGASGGCDARVADCPDIWPPQQGW